MIKEVLYYESEHPVQKIRVPIEYGGYEIVVQTRNHWGENIDDYLERIKKQEESHEQECFLMVLNQIFNKEYWEDYYKNKQENDKCSCCGGDLPVGFFNERLKQLEENIKYNYGVKLIPVDFRPDETYDPH